MSMPKKQDRQNDFATQMQARVKRFGDMDANIEQHQAVAKNLLHTLEQMPPISYAAPDAHKMARMQRLHADIGDVIADTQDLFQERNTMVLADHATDAAGASANVKPWHKPIAHVDLTHSDSDVEVIGDSDDDDVPIVRQRAAP